MHLFMHVYAIQLVRTCMNGVVVVTHRNVIWCFNSLKINIPSKICYKSNPLNFVTSNNSHLKVLTASFPGPCHFQSHKLSQGLVTKVT